MYFCTHNYCWLLFFTAGQSVSGRSFLLNNSLSNRLSLQAPKGEWNVDDQKLPSMGEYDYWFFPCLCRFHSQPKYTILILTQMGVYVWIFYGHSGVLHSLFQKVCSMKRNLCCFNLHVPPFHSPPPVSLSLSLSLSLTYSHTHSLFPFSSLLFTHAQFFFQFVVCYVTLIQTIHSYQT